MISAILICLIALAYGAPQSFNRMYDGRTRNTVNTSNFGFRQPSGQLEQSYESLSSPATTLPAKNARTLEEENRFLPLIKALQNIKETNNPAPGDINTLLAFSKELKNDASKDETSRSLEQDINSLLMLKALLSNDSGQEDANPLRALSRDFKQLQTMGSIWRTFFKQQEDLGQKVNDE